MIQDTDHNSADDLPDEIRPETIPTEPADQSGTASSTIADGPPAEPETPTGAELCLDDFLRDTGQPSTAAGSACSLAALRRRGRASAQISSLRLLVLVALAAALPRRLRRALRQARPLALVIEVPSAGWVAPMETGIRVESCANAMLLARTGAPKRGSDDADREAVRALASTHPVVAITPNRAWISPVLLAAADHLIEISPLSPELITQAIELWCGRKLRHGLDEEAIAGLDLLDVAAALRPGDSPAICLDWLVRASASRLEIEPTLAVPPLGSLTGYGAAHDWATELVSTIARVRAGETSPSFLESAVFSGVPGTGKTTLAIAIAQAARVPVRQTTVASWFGQSSYLDAVTKAIDTFCDGLEIAARQAGVAIGVWDEIDALPNRNRVSQRNADYWVPIVNHVLVRVERLRRCGVVLLAATNDLARVDPALLRPGRFDRHFEIMPPDETGRLGIIRAHLGADLAGADLGGAARLSHGMTGAVIAGYVRAARRRADAKGRPLDLDDLLAEIAPADTRSPADLRGAALHEGGHAIAAYRLGQCVVRVSTEMRPGQGGVTTIRSDDPTPDRGALERQVIVLLSGRAADVRLGAGADAGASADLAEATRLLVALHEVHGLGDRLSVRAGPENAVQLLHRDPDLASKVESDLGRLSQMAEMLIWANRDAVAQVADALVARRVLTGAEIAVIADANRPRVRVRAQARPFRPS